MKKVKLKIKHKGEEFTMFCTLMNEDTNFPLQVHHSGVKDEDGMQLDVNDTRIQLFHHIAIAFFKKKYQGERK